MGTVIAFPLRKEPRSTVVSEKLGGTGEILLFTGVRYSRSEPASVRRCGNRAVDLRREDEDASA